MTPAVSVLFHQPRSAAGCIGVYDVSELDGAVGRESPVRRRGPRPPGVEENRRSTGSPPLLDTSQAVTVQLQYVDVSTGLETG